MENETVIQYLREPTKRKKALEYLYQLVSLQIKKLIKKD